MRQIRRIKKSFVAAAAFLVAACVLYSSAAAGKVAYGAATVAATSLNIRSGPDTTYPAVSSVAQGEKVVILEKTSEKWYKVVYRGVEGYVAAEYLKDVLKAENFDATGVLTGDDVLIRSAPSTSGKILGICDKGTIVKIIGINNGWYKVRHSGITGYIRSDYISITADAPAGSSSASGSSGGEVSGAVSTLRKELVDLALKYVGSSYVYGGASPSCGFDCSGLVYYVFKQFDYELCRSASDQYASDGAKISKSELLPGDLVFFSSNGGYSITHVGIYIGNNRFVHASSPKVGVVISDLGSRYYTSVWYGAKRILPV